MAIVPLHRQMTIEVLREFGFNQRAAELGADANAAVDEKQGSDASEANLHAMRGFAEARRMQDVDEARRAVEALLNQRKTRILEHVQASRFREAITELGAALHTVQDREYHGFEPWPFDGLLASITSPNLALLYGLSAHYMLCHAIRDVGL